MSDSLRAHGMQPSRLLSPRNFPGKNTGVGCHSLLQGLHRLDSKKKRNKTNQYKFCKLTVTGKYIPVCVSVTQSCPTLCDPHEMQPTRLLCPWDYSDKYTRVGYHSLFQGIFPIQGSNLGLLFCRQILYHLSHQRCLDYLMVQRKMNDHIVKVVY